MTTDAAAAIDKVDLDIPEETTSQRDWRCGKHKVPSTEIVFFSQIVVVYIVIITCIANLSLSQQPRDLWISLLSSCLGYILPSPAIRKGRSSKHQST